MAILSGRAKLAGVMGWPVSHSRSPGLHGYWLEHYGVDGAYVPLAVVPDRLRDAIGGLVALGFRGVNLTLPHKEAALGHVDDLSATARRIGAVNTIVVGADGKLRGDNTDAFGFLEHLKASAPQWRADARPVAVLGAGGAARAVIVALLDEGVIELRLINRSPERASKLREAFGPAITVVDWAARSTALSDVSLLVNATSLGMSGQAPLDLALDRLNQTTVVYDLVYAPLDTPLLKAARQRGNAVVDGLGMLLHQARPGFQAWFGVEPEVTAALRAFVLDDLKA
ncbi:MAG: shikimate dehydrogenase [Alphaproteobacteria bacterium]|nr:shikimate dehydrogenase [Alphaproteobacteria bacterium]